MPELIEPQTILINLLETLSPQLRRCYERSINKDLAQHNLENLFQRNIVNTIQQAYQEINSQTSVTQADLPVIEKWLDSLVEYALKHNRSSCALSNFPTEHNPDQQYINSTLQLLEKDWLTFTAPIKQSLSSDHAQR